MKYLGHFQYGDREMGVFITNYVHGGFAIEIYMLDKKGLPWDKYCVLSTRLPTTPELPYRRFYENHDCYDLLEHMKKESIVREDRRYPTQESGMNKYPVMFIDPVHLKTDYQEQIDLWILNYQIQNN